MSSSTICQLEQNKVLQEFGLKLYLIQLDPEQIPLNLAVGVLNHIYGDFRCSPSNLQNVCQSLFFAVKHIEAVC
jgi:hypothetical protein